MSQHPSMPANIRPTENHQLNDSQLKAFLHSEGIPQRMASALTELPAKIGRPVQSILDCGGGNGLYLDKLLDLFPNAKGTLVDSAQFMLDQNTPHPRKQLLLENLENMDSLVQSGQTFDLICFSDVLHHCIVSNYQETRNVQTNILATASTLLAPNGIVLVAERIIDSWITDEFSVHLIYALTRSRSLAMLIRMLGANTAGVGVCFLSRNRLQRLCHDAGLALIEEIHLDTAGQHSLATRFKRIMQHIGLGAKSLRHDLFLLK